ncbi:MAG: PSD1 domain-containing protein [Planctomyces sp.]|nr:PSD1 domain-containing protein [Planctomyces sp.]
MLTLIASCLGIVLTGQIAEAQSAVKVSFNQSIRRILYENCVSCHGPDAAHRKAELRLDERESAIASGAIVPGNPGDSSLLERVTSHDDKLVMPPKDTGKSLTPVQVDLLRRWIAEGAEYQKHWAYLRPDCLEPPDTVSGKPESPGHQRSDHPIDRFVRHRLSAAGLTPSPMAAPETLIRRLHLDLIGLPPTPEEIDEFLNNFGRDPRVAIEAKVDELLASPHYGERWGRWWLDQARYADSHGYSIDAPRQIWPWRDWVISALNTDMSFDEFTLEQLAGDLLPDASESQKVATGFHRNTQINQEGGIDPEQFRIDSVFDRVATTSSVWLGLTIGCAQCHDHKFDPITQKEYYQLFAFLNDQDEPSMKVFGSAEDGQRLNEQVRQLEQAAANYIRERQSVLGDWEAGLNDKDRESLPKEVITALKEGAKKRSDAQWRSLFGAGPGKTDLDFQKIVEDLKSIRNQIDSAPTTLVFQERASPRKSTILIKGDFTRPDAEVFPGTPALLHPLESSGGRANRIDLARWLTSRENPLTARVIVNRIWQQYFGRGIVETESDFGSQGTLPSHPELLDWLAIEFMDQGWSMKRLHRLIVTSATYQQSSTERTDLRAKDPHNYLLGRQQRLRLEAELIRDAALVASGLLSKKMGGPPVYPPIPDGVMGTGQVKHAWNVSQGEDRYRRGCYTFAFRASPPPVLNVFDAPDGYSTCTRRLRSNTPLQALTLLNDQTSIEFAGALKLLIENKGLEYAFRRCTSRVPQQDELSVLETLSSADAARVLLNLDETISRE